MAWVFLDTLLEIIKPSTLKDVIGCWPVIWIVCHHLLDHCSLRGDMCCVAGKDCMHAQAACANNVYNCLCIMSV